MNASQLFKAAHALTKKIRQAGDDYRATFGLCLRHIIKWGVSTMKSVKENLVDQINEAANRIEAKYAGMAARIRHNLKGYLEDNKDGLRLEHLLRDELKKINALKI